MLNNKIIFIILFIGLLAIPFTCAEDNITSSDSVLSASSDDSYSNIYFDSSLSQDNGNGSIDNPYKYLGLKEGSSIEECYDAYNFINASLFIVYPPISKPIIFDSDYYSIITLVCQNSVKYLLRKYISKK